MAGSIDLEEILGAALSDLITGSLEGGTGGGETE